MVTNNTKNLHIEISKDLDNRIREVTHKVAIEYDKELTRKHLVTSAIVELLDLIEADKEALEHLVRSNY